MLFTPFHTNIVYLYDLLVRTRNSNVNDVCAVIAVWVLKEVVIAANRTLPSIAAISAHIDIQDRPVDVQNLDREVVSRHFLLVLYV